MYPEVSNLDEELRNILCSLFVKNKDDLRDGLQDNEIAAIASAADWMAKCTDYVFAENAVRDNVVDLFGKSEDEEVKKIYNMTSSVVKAIIGYSVEFEDYSAALAAYNVQAPLYNGLYERMQRRIEEKGFGGR